MRLVEQHRLRLDGRWLVASAFAEDDISTKVRLGVRLLRSHLRIVARHARLSDPEATTKAPDAAALPHRNLACMRGKSARADSRSAREGEPGGLTPPLGSPAAALRRATGRPPSDVGRARACVRPPPVWWLARSYSRNSFVRLAGMANERERERNSFTSPKK